MTEYTKLLKDLVIEDDIKDSYGGELYGTIKIGNPTTNEAYGYVDYGLYRGRINSITSRDAKFGDIFHIKMIEVFKPHQRKGYATKLMNYIRKKYKGYKIDSGMLTEEGAKFMKQGKHK
jgi:GNAT superfamily N-acetyltransferase